MEFFEALKSNGVSDIAILNTWKMFSGCPIYIPKFKNNEMQQRNEKIYSEFNGHNRFELAIKYDLTYQRICKIITISVSAMERKGK